MIAGIVVVAPLLLAMLVVAGGRASRIATGWAPAASALLLWPVGCDVQVETHWLLEGIFLRADEVARPLLLLTALAWTAATLQARRTLRDGATGFWVGWLLALSGMNLVLLAGDLVSFYLGYALSSLSAALLVVHYGTPAAWRAGRVYLVMAVLGETSVLSGVLLVAGVHGNAPLELLAGRGLGGVHDAAGWLLLAGFAVKLGIVPLHVWLPLAHPEAPVPASAILSGVLVKAGLLGWLRMVPGDALGGPAPSTLLLALGLGTAFGGAGMGLVQRRPKTVLAYSTVSQMGLVLVGFSLAIRAPGERAALVAALGLFALHHGLNKAALFLACGASPGASRARLGLTALPALAIAAAPLSSGWVAKKLLEKGVHGVGLDEPVGWLLALTSTATALTMWRFLSLVAGEGRSAAPIDRGGPWWLVLTGLGLAVPWGWAGLHHLAPAVTPAKLWAGTWPLLLAAALVLLGGLLPRRVVPRLPEGDWVVLAEGLAERLRHVRLPALPRLPGHWSGAFERRTTHLAHALEARLGLIPLTGALMLVVGGALLWLLLRPW